MSESESVRVSVTLSERKGLLRERARVCGTVCGNHWEMGRRVREKERERKRENERFPEERERKRK